MTSAAREPLTETQIVAALERHDYRVAAAARELGVTRQGLYEALDRIGLEITAVRGLRRTSSTP